MGTVFSTGFVLLDTADYLLSSVVDIEFHAGASGDVLVVASGGEYGVSSWDLSGPSPSEVSQIVDGLDSGTTALSDTLLLDAFTGPKLVTLGRFDNNFGLADLDSGGALSAPVAMTDAGGNFERGLVGDTVRIGNNAFFYVAQHGQPGLGVYRFNATDAYKLLDTVSDTPDLFLGDVADIHYGRLHDKNFLFAASAFDAGLEAFTIRDGGRIDEAGSLAPGPGLGFADTTAIASLQIGDRAFVFLASAGTDNLISLRMSKGAAFTVIDQTTDTNLTRFAHAQVMEAFQTDDRSFLLVGGADNGLSLFEITYQGHFVHLESIGDDFTTTLADVSALKVVVDGTTARAFVGSASEHGVTELFLDLDRSGDEIFGTVGRDTINGTSGDDVIWGDGQTDSLYGLDGDDRLIDGNGRDFLYGGAGADTFVFFKDGISDRIEDFELGIDRIDLSYFDGIYYYGDLDLQSRGSGAIIFLSPTEIIRINNIDGTAFDIADFDQDDFIFG